MQPQHIETHCLDSEDIRLKRFIRRCSILTVRPPRLVECAGKETQSAIEKGLRGIRVVRFPSVVHGLADKSNHTPMKTGGQEKTCAKQTCGAAL